MFSAREVVWWYNGHPDYRHLPVDLARAEAVVVFGLGNVRTVTSALWSCNDPIGILLSPTEIPVELYRWRWTVRAFCCRRQRARSRTRTSRSTRWTR